MRIGEFAKLCDTKISVLRHYDKEGVLTPNYVDSMTGYRYYSKEQVQNFQRIKVLSRAGFSLKEIREVLPQIDDIAFLQRKIEEKKEELNKVFSNLEKAKELLLYNQHEEEYQIQEIEGRKICKIPILMPMVNEKFSEVCQQLEEIISRLDCQRVSGFQTYSEPDREEGWVGAEILKLEKNMKDIHENISYEFVNDDVVGRWKVMGEYAVKEDFYAEIQYGDAWFGNTEKEIYFLPNGERYWGIFAGRKVYQHIWR